MYLLCIFFLSLSFILFKMVKYMVRMSTLVFLPNEMNGNGKDGLFA